MYLLTLSYADLGLLCKKSFVLLFILFLKVMQYITYLRKKVISYATCYITIFLPCKMTEITDS